MRTLQSRQSNQVKPPKRFMSLQCLIDKFHVSDSEDTADVDTETPEKETEQQDDEDDNKDDSETDTIMTPTELGMGMVGSPGTFYESSEVVTSATKSKTHT